MAGVPVGQTSASNLTAMRCRTRRARAAVTEPAPGWCSARLFIPGTPSDQRIGGNLFVTCGH